jgi:hypothetical protein
MKIITFAKWNSMSDFMEGKPADIEVSDGWEGVIARLDRAAQAAASSAGKNATTVAANAGGNAQQEEANLSPFYTREMNAKHGFDPTQTNELLTNALAGSGGSTSALTGSAGLEAARTRNPSGFTKSLDEVARDSQKAAAGASEGVAAEDVMAAKQENQQGAAGEAGLFGENTKAQLGAMGQEAGDVNAEINAGNSGWEQQLEGGLNTVANVSRMKV